MDMSFAIASLARFPAVLLSVTHDLPSATWLYKPDSETWSILEIVCHLRDEEVEDFRYRVRSTLEDPSKPWPPIDPPQAAIDRKYQEDDPQAAIESFMKERAESLRWLKTLENPEWTICHEHSKVGPVPASRLLGSWAAHDLLHLRQITKRLFECTQIAAEHSLDYAGEW
ncbi:MAG: DinB family protein [Planctomycetota bacterium]